MASELQAFGTVIEYDSPVEGVYTVFRMESRYYLGELGQERFPLALDGYEQAEGFHPVWVAVETALRRNRVLLAAGEGARDEWLKREVFMLDEVRRRLCA